MVKLSVIIPCYNEGKNIPLLLERFKKVMKRNDIELVLVNNGSNDETEIIFKKLLNKYPFARAVNVKKNIGYGNGVFVGLKSAKGKFLAWTHADMQTDVKDVFLALTLIDNLTDKKKCFVKGERKERSIFDAFFTRGMTMFTCIILGKWLSEINAQPNLFHKSFIKYIQEPPLDFSFDLYTFYIAKKNNLKIIRFPVYFKKRVHGHSHWNTGLFSKLKLIIRTIKFIIKLKRRGI